MPLIDQHPLEEELKAFALGRLGDDLFAAVEKHVTACSDCEAVVARISGDAFTALLQSAQSLSDTPKPLFSEVTAVESRNAVGSLTSPWTGATDAVETDLPAVLANHPRYRPLRRLGSGGMGTVWLAEHRIMGRQVAVKVIRPEFVAKAGAAERFRRETQTAAMLAHPNIVTAFDAEQAGATPLLAMEYIDGVTLADLVREQGPLPVVEACDAIRQAALGLQHAVGCGLIHRDLKPHNLMRTADGNVKVLDFGLAVLADAGRDAAGLTAENMVLGTPDYIAPEQAEDARAADVRSDIYSLGCTLYHLLTGHVPFPGDSVLRKLDAHRTLQPEPIRKSRPDVPATLATIVAKMMAKKPSDRYQTPGEVAEALAPFAAGTTPVRKRRRSWVAAAAMLLAGIVVAAGVVYRIQTDNGEVVITPESPDVEIVLLKGGKEMEVIDTKTNKRVTVPTGAYDVVVKNKPDGIEVKTDKIVVSRGKEVLVTIERIAKATPALMKGGEKKMLEGFNDVVWSVAFAPDGRSYFATGGVNQLYERATGRELARCPGSSSWFAAFSPDSGRVLTGNTTANELFVWDAAAGKHLQTIKADVGRIRNGAFSPDGQMLITNHWNTVRVWDLKTSKQLAVFDADPDSQHCFQIVPGGRRLLVANPDHSIRVVDMITWQETGRWKPHAARIGDLAISPDGRTLLVCTWGDQKTFVWDVVSGRELGQLGDESQHVHVAVFAPDGHRAISANQDGTIILWDVAGRKELQRWEKQGDIVSVAISPDGRDALFGLGSQKAFLMRLPDPPHAEKVDEVRRPGPLQDRSAHEKSIYEMAELAFAMQDFDKAALYYNQATRQYPSNPGVPTARYQLGECYRKLAELAQGKLQAAKYEKDKVHHQNTHQLCLKQGADAYETLADELEHRARQNPLSALELSLLRKALFGAADLHFDMNEFSEALRRYQTLQDKYRKQVEGLIACQRIWRCVGVMVDIPEQALRARAAAVAAVKLAQTDLAAMPEDSECFRGGNGVWTKDNWQRWLRWVSDQLNPPKVPVTPNPVIK